MNSPVLNFILALPYLIALVMMLVFFTIMVAPPWRRYWYQNKRVLLYFQGIVAIPTALILILVLVVNAIDRLNS